MTALLERFVGQLGFVMGLVLRTQAFQDQNRFFDRRRFDFHGLEAAFQRGVLFDVLAILVQRGRADALQFAAAKRRLDDVRGVHRAFGGTGADDRVQLVDEQDDVFRAADLVHDRLDALFELSAVFGAGDHQREVEGDDFFVAQKLRHVAIRDFLGEAFDDGRFANPGFA